MFAKFWIAIHDYPPWHHATDKYSQQALRTYQAQQRKKWHLAAGTTYNWSLAVITQGVLWETRDVLIANAHEQPTEVSFLQRGEHFRQ